MFVAMQGLLHNSSNCYIDSTKLAVCDNHRIHQHKVFKGLAQRGKTSMGWFYGLKLHVIINDKGALISFCFSAGNVSDNNKEIVGYLCRYLQNGVKVFGDAGYVSQNLFDMLYKQGITLITKIRKNMKNKLLTLKDKWLLKKRTLVETAIDLWKHIGDLWHTRHRSVDNAFNNVLACLAAYHFNDHKPSSKMSKKQYLLQLLN